MTNEPQIWTRDVAAVDYLMYRGEVDPRTRSSMMSVEILDEMPDWDRLREDMDRASRVVPRLRQRIVAPVLPITRARWVIDPDFSLDYHLRRVRCPSPGTFRQVLDLAQSFYATPLDMSRPLWEAILVEGVDAEGGQAAFFWKLSHSITDGVGGIELDRQIRSYEREARRGPMPPLPVPEDLESVALTRKAAVRLPFAVARETVRRTGDLLGAGRRALRNPPDAVGGVSRFMGSLGRIMGAPPVDPSPLLRRRSLNRRFETLDVPLDGLRRAAKNNGCSVNDAYIAALCGALRRYHDALGVPVDALPLAMPVSLRSGDDPAGGNQWAGVRIPAPIGEPDPVKRMNVIREHLITGKAEPAINALGALSPVLARLPMQLVVALGSEGASTDVQASNVPGHAQDTHIGGAKVLCNFPFGPLPGAAMMVVMLSHVGRCYVGINYDTASVTDSELFARCLQEGFDEVMAVEIR
ncbi:MAG TPA: wax ester/triacylglycerol synthase domain-containing protein [Acidimicrobiales bacterium]|jgi:WS/DGAT/MGAT family acyltransferase|nr:wax ester/triacylglycerol synthase domain-containing protein [Acidimicrobiales bacterium]